ncbi:MAG: hypothetical protein ACRCXT_05005 [Paraclostridium sp.]
MKDSLYLARCNEAEVNQYIQTLNDYTLLLTKDTHNLYTKVNGTRLHLATGSTLFSLDQPILKELSVFATNDDGVLLIQDRYYGICGNDDGTYRICESVEYDGELLGVLDSTIPVDGDKYVIKLIENKNVFTDVASEMVKWKPVYIGTYQNTIIAVVNPDKLDTVFGIGGVVTDITLNPLVGKFTYNGFLLQATYFARLHTDDEHIKDVVRMLLSDYYTKTEIDVMMQRVTTLETQVTTNTNALNDVYTKNEINVKLHDKMNTSDSYNRTEIDGKLENKSDKVNTYTKTEVDNLIQTGTIPNMPDRGGLFAFDKNKAIQDIVPINLATKVIDNEDTKIITTTSDGRLWVSSDWLISELGISSPTNKNTFIDIKEANGNKVLSLKSKVDGTNPGLVLTDDGDDKVKLKFKNSNLYMSGNDNVDKRLLNTDDVIGGVQTVSEVRLRASDKRILEVVLTDGTIKHVDLTPALVAYLAKSGVRLVHQLKDTTWDNFSFEGKLELNEVINVDLNIADRSKLKAGDIDIHKDSDTGYSYYRIEDPLCNCTFNFYSQGKWRDFTQTINTGDGEFKVDFIIYQRAINGSTWVEVYKGESSCNAVRADKTAFELSTGDINFTTLNHGVDIRVDIQIKSVPNVTGFQSTGEKIRFGLWSLKTSAQTDPEYQNINLLFNPIPQANWKPFTITREV